MSSTQVKAASVSVPDSVLPYRDEDLPRLEPRYADLKKSIIKPENVEKVKQSYARLLKALDVEADRIKSLQHKAIPECNYKDITENGNKLPESLIAESKHSGCLIVRGVVDPETAIKWKDDLRAYALRHPKKVQSSSTYPYHWTPSQVQSRSHPDVLRVLNIASKLWQPSNDNVWVDLQSQVVYSDRFRIRYPEDGEGTLPPHLDSSATERWEDPSYRSCYAKIFEGNWEEFDPWCVDQRLNAKLDLFKKSRSQSVFRSLQGWLALSQTNIGEGTLQLVPNIKLVTAYIMLRPFFMQGIENFDGESSVFPGCEPGRGQFFPTEKYHPHLRLQDTMVSIPPINPGDFVFWHCDQVHMVDKIHAGPKGKDSSVVYIAVTPLCVENIRNMIENREGFKKCEPIADFAHDTLTIKDGAEKDHTDHGARMENILSHEGMKGLGFAEYDENEAGITVGAKKVRRMANEAMKR